MKKITYAPWHPFVFGIFYVFSIYQTSAEHHPVRVVILPLCFILFTVALFYGLFCALTRNSRSAALYSSLFILLVLVFPFLRETIENLSGVDLRTWLFAVLIGGAFLLLRMVPRKMKASPGVTRALNLVALCCLVPPVFSTAGSRVGVAAGRKLVGNVPAMERWVIPAASADVHTAEAPDIIHVVLDGYARGDVLKRLYAYDNSAFLNALRDLGFYVADKAAANYCQTGLSMSSSLNAHYLDLPPHFERTNDRSVLKVLIQKGSIPVFLQDNGYTVRLYDSGYYLTDSMAGAEIVETSSSLWTEFAYDVVRRSLLSLPDKTRMAVLPKLGNDTLYRQHRNRILHAFEYLAREPLSADRPTYTFAHLLTPHPPFMFPEPPASAAAPSRAPYTLNDGSHRTTRMKGGPPEYRERYVRQLKVVNGMVLAAVSSMIENAQRPLVVILQSDHGPGSALNWNNVMASDAQERLAILTAVYFSDGQYTSLYPEVTPINLWRVILNTYFLSEKMEKLDDTSYLSSWPRPYLFHEYDPSGDADL